MGATFKSNGAYGEILSFFMSNSLFSYQVFNIYYKTHNLLKENLIHL